MRAVIHPEIIMNNSKQELRKNFSERRFAISAFTRENAANQIALQLAQQSFYKCAQHIAAYMGVKEELNVQAIIETIWQDNKNCYLPVLSQHKILKFIRYKRDDPLLPNRFAIPEPKVHAEERPPDKLDLVILPLLAFDRCGNRLGTGGGYYDHTFEFMSSHSLKKPILVGVAFAAQEAQTLPREKWDIQLNYIITEKEVITC